MTPSSDDRRIRILTVDDHPQLREGIAALLADEADMVVVAEAKDGSEAIDQFRAHRPDVTLMDLRLPGTNGTDTLIAIRGEFPDARIIMLSMSDSDGEIMMPLKAANIGPVSSLANWASRERSFTWRSP